VSMAAPSTEKTTAPASPKRSHSSTGKGCHHAAAFKVSRCCERGNHSNCYTASCCCECHKSGR